MEKSSNRFKLIKKLFTSTIQKNALQSSTNLSHRKAGEATADELK